MPIPQVYRRTPEGAIASYDWVDVAEGTGILEIKGFRMITSTATTYGLSGSNIFPDEISTSASVGQGNFAKILDLDFDSSPFNSPRVMRGKAIFVVPILLTGNLDANITAFVIVKVRKWDGITESEIASVTSPNKNSGVGSGTRNLDHRLVLPLTIPQTNFKIGETLRITIEGWARIPELGGAGTMAIGHDPFATDIGGTGIITALQVNYLPFRIDL